VSLAGAHLRRGRCPFLKASSRRPPLPTCRCAMICWHVVLLQLCLCLLRSTCSFNARPPEALNARQVHGEYNSGRMRGGMYAVQPSGFICRPLFDHPGSLMGIPERLRDLSPRAVQQKSAQVSSGSSRGRGRGRKRLEREKERAKHLDYRPYQRPLSSPQLPDVADRLARHAVLLGEGGRQP
jgi:hypothetical protein